MERELNGLNEAIDKVMNCNLDDKTKEIILNALRKRLFELRSEIDKVNKDIEFYHK